MSKYKIEAEFEGGTGFTKPHASIWLLIKTLWVFIHYDNKPPLTITLTKEKKA